MEPNNANIPKSSHVFRNLNIIFILLLILIPIIIFSISLVSGNKSRYQIEAKFMASPSEILIFDDLKGLNSKNFSKIQITYKNNSKKDFTGLKLYIPTSFFGNRGKATAGVVDRKVSIDNKAYAASGKQYLVLNLPDIKPGQKQNVHLYSLYSRSVGELQMPAEIRTKEGLIFFVNPVTIKVK